MPSNGPYVLWLLGRNHARPKVYCQQVKRGCGRNLSMALRCAHACGSKEGVLTQAFSARIKRLRKNIYSGAPLLSKGSAAKTRLLCPRATLALRSRDPRARFALTPLRACLRQSGVVHFQEFNGTAKAVPPPKDQTKLSFSAGS
jgi:hypothetical protein